MAITRRIKWIAATLIVAALLIVGTVFVHHFPPTASHRRLADQRGGLDREGGRSDGLPDVGSSECPIHQASGSTGRELQMVQHRHEESNRGTSKLARREALLALQSRYGHWGRA